MPDWGAIGADLLTYLDTYPFTYSPGTHTGHNDPSNSAKSPDVNLLLAKQAAIAAQSA